MCTIRFGYLYDLRLKVTAVNREASYSVFRKVLFNYQTGGQYLFDKDDPVGSISRIDVETVF